MIRQKAKGKRQKAKVMRLGTLSALRWLLLAIIQLLSLSLLKTFRLYCTDKWKAEKFVNMAHCFHQIAMRRLVVFAFCLLPFVFCLLPSPTFAQRATSKRAPAVESQNDLSSATRQSLEQAIAFLQQNNLTEAEKAARSAVASSPRSPV